MQPTRPLYHKYKDFESPYIIELAKQRGYMYTESVLNDPGESSLFNNEKTNTTEMHKMSFVVDGLACEYYTASYTPLIYSTSKLASLEETHITNPETDPGRTFQVQVFSIELPYLVENLYVESKTNPTLNNVLGLSSVVFKNTVRVRLEGDFNTFFRAYTVEKQELNAFTILAPNIMLRMMREASDYDFEFSGRRVYFYKTFAYASGSNVAMALNRMDYDALLAFGIAAAKDMVRAGRPAKTSQPTPPMWTSYGMDDRRLGVYIALFFLGFLFLGMTFVIPLLWPIALVFVVFGFVKYERFKSKRKKLITKASAL